MAHLIKLNFKPKKWQLYNAHKQFPTNTIIDENQYKKINTTLNNLINEKTAVREKIRLFHKLKDNYKSLSHAHSIRKYKIRLAIEAIITLISWQNNINKESHALVVLVKKIAQNIMSVNELPLEINADTSFLKESLQSFIRFHIALKAEALATVSRRYERLIAHFNLSLVEIEKEDTKALLSVTILDSSFTLDFADADIDKILASVQNQLLCKDSAIAFI